MKSLLRCLMFIAVLILFSSSHLSAAPLKLATTYWPPYTDVQNTAAPGLFVEVAREVFSRMNQEIAIEEFPWKRSQLYAKNGEVDAIFAAAYSEERAQYAVYPKAALGPLSYVFFLQAADLLTFAFDSADDLKSLVIGAIDGSAVVNIPIIAESAEKWGNVQFTVGEKSEQEGMLKLDRKIIDCYAGSLLTGQAMVRQLKEQGRIQSDIQPYLTKPLQETDLFLIFSKQAGYTDDHPTVIAFTQALEEFRQTEKYQEIIRKYTHPQ